jgi:hypothetical protein
VDDISGLTLLQAADLVTHLKVNEHLGPFFTRYNVVTVATKHQRNCDAYSGCRSGSCRSSV